MLPDYRHIEDYQYKGHEIIIIRENTSDHTGYYAVDVRADAFDGEIIAGYDGIDTLDGALAIGHAFVDGTKYGEKVTVRFN